MCPIVEENKAIPNGCSFYWPPSAAKDWPIPGNIGAKWYWEHLNNIADERIIKKAISEDGIIIFETGK
jgi:hypothetical protein